MGVFKTFQTKYENIEREQKEINQKFDFFCEELKKLPTKKKKALLDQLQSIIYKKQEVRRF